LNNTLHNYPIFHRHIKKLGGYILSRVFLDFVYLTYILIFAEYLNVEKLQLDAARIVTGLPIFTKTDKLYSETGWTTLSSRRHNRKLQLFYNIKNERIPKCLDTLKIIFSMWLFHLASLDRVTPKCLWLIVIGILFPLNVKLKLYLESPKGQF
jgi:hypothetical protein